MRRPALEGNGGVVPVQVAELVGRGVAVVDDGDDGDGLLRADVVHLLVVVRARDVPVYFVERADVEDLVHAALAPGAGKTGSPGPAPLVSLRSLY